MKHKTFCKAFALFLCLALLVGCFPLTAFAETAATAVTMTEGDVLTDFVPAGTECTSTDTSIAWVDENGSLNALKPGTVTVSDGQTDYTVTVGDYDDGSEVVGNLKLLARYNDSMQFYDGHVYLLFTSYQDGVEIKVDDLYASYDIDDAYYTDIREDIANGSNHTGNDAEKYFTFNNTVNSVTLNRGEIVTIGMYRDFDMSVPQAALGSIKNSSLWSDLTAAGKTAVIESIFRLMETGSISAEDAFARFQQVLDAENLDYNKLIDGVVEGGVCFNRELYNQKLEWDQYENVTYEMDITRNQLNTVTQYLNGNLNKFSILKNSCATVALRAWNAAVGSRDGQPTAYALNYTGSGIFSIIDAPKSVRDSMVARLPGYYLNNAEGVAEPDAGYQDDTGWVYVSAPEKVSPVVYHYAESAVQVDESKTKMPSLINAAKAGQNISYAKDAQEINVAVQGGATDVSAVDFTINGTTVSLNGENMPAEGVWFKTAVQNPVEGTLYYVTDNSGRVLPSTYADGVVSFRADTLPVSFTVTGDNDSYENLLQITSVNGDKVQAPAQVYSKAGGDKTVLDTTAQLRSGTDIYIQTDPAELDYLLTSATLNGEEVLNDAHFDEAENAYHVTMPATYSKLVLTYGKAVVNTKGSNHLQVSVGDTLNVTDYATLTVGETDASNQLVWKVISDEDGALQLNGSTLQAMGEGYALVWACAKNNDNIGVLFVVEVYSDTADMVKISFNESVAENLLLTAEKDGNIRTVPFDGYLVEKGSALTITPNQQESKAILSLIDHHGNTIHPGEPMIVEEDTTVRAAFAGAAVTGMPKTVNLAQKGDTYALTAKVQYTGIFSFIPPYDPSIRYESSDALVSVDENGLLTVADEAPENGKVVFVTAYAGSANDKVYAVTRVVVGDYQGDRIVGRLTISARPIVQAQLVAHGAVTFTTYEDTDLNVSYYNYYKPNQKYIDLSHDYDAHPEKYTSDPILYNNNELGIDDRESYFDSLHSGSETPAQTLHLQSGEGITMSNYGYESANLITIVKALQDSSISSSKEAQELVRQINNYTSGEDFDGVSAFDSFVATVGQIIATSRATGHNPADGHSEGGLDINREVFNQFRRSDSQLPNNYYTVEITADEFAMMEQYLSNPANNYYSLMDRNCATGAVDIWNATLADKPELHLTGNYTGVAVEPESLYVELGLLQSKEGIDGEGGKDFYPRIVPPYTAEETFILGDADGDGTVTISDVTAIQRALSEMEVTGYNSQAADVDGDGSVTINDATYIQRYLAELPVDYPIGQ